MRLVLASASPRRHELLRLTQVPFEIYPVDLDETPLCSEDPLSLVRRLAHAKASTAQLHSGDASETWFLGCDTVVIKGHQIFGKPDDFDQSLLMLRQLSGAAHQVMTAVALLGPNGWIREFQQVTEVHFHPITDDDIAAYWATGEPQDKAGSYAIQGIGARFVREIRGHYHTVVGLPIDGLIPVLIEAGFNVWPQTNV